MELNLNGRACLVTGASSGIGGSVARALAHEGVRLALAGRNIDALASLREELSKEGLGEAILCPGDVSTSAGVRDVVEQAKSGLGRIDILVNNAGGSRPLAGAETESVWEESFALNFSAARRLSEMLIPDMAKSGWGRIINITGAVVYWNVNAAVPAKAALQSWSKGLAAELAPRGITVNSIAPGRINTRQILEKLHPTAESRQKFIDENIPIGHFGEPEDISNVVAFLASPLSNYITGIVIPVDGGLFRLSL